MTPYDTLLGKLPESPKTWLITGVAGFIGSNLLETLLKLGQRVIGLDNFCLLYTSIFLANREAVLRTLDTFRDDLDALRDAVDAGDGHQLLGVFTRARVAREHFSKILARRAYVDAMHSTDLIFLAKPGSSLSGRIRVPGDKSISHRSICLLYTSRCV